MKMSNSNPLRVLVVGCGVIAPLWLDHLTAQSDLSIVGLCDLDQQKADALALEYSLSCATFCDFAHALEHTRPHLVCDLTYVTNHEKICLHALGAGCHVFGEKPMALTHAQAIKMVGFSKECNKRYVVMQNRRYTKGIRAIKSLLCEGDMGKPLMVHAELFVPADLRSIRNTLQNPMLQDNAVHTFDQMRFVTGADAVFASCHTFRPSGALYKGDCAGLSTFIMSDESVCSFRCMMGAPARHTSWEASWRIDCESGCITWDGIHAPTIYRKERSHPQEAEQTWTGGEQHAGALDDMLHALRTGTRAPTDCTDNIKSMAMVFACEHSAKTGQVTDVRAWHEV